MIKLEGVSHRIPTSTGIFTALQKIDLSIGKGEAVALMGANGSGKSTLCRCLNGLIVPEEGMVHVGSLCTRDPASADEIRRLVGMVFQDPSHQLISWSVEQEIAFGLENLRLPPTAIGSTVHEALTEWKLGEFRGRHPLRLSCGQMARLALAAVMAMRPSYLVVDEPTSLLDRDGRAALLSAVSRIRGRGDVGVLWVTQFPEEAACFDRLVVMNGGCVVADDSPGRLLSDSGKLEGWGLAPPPAAMMAASLRARGIEIVGEVFLVEHLLDELESMGLKPGAAECGFEKAEGKPASRQKAVVLTGPGAGSAAEKMREAAQKPISRARGVPSPLGSPLGSGQAAPVLSVRGLSCGYPGEGEVLKDVSVEVGPGEGLGLVGPSGSGKSTFVFAASGALKPARGAVSRGGDEAALPRVGLSAQLPEEQFCAPTVFEEVALSLRGTGRSEGQVRRTVEERLLSVGADYGRIAPLSPLSISEGEKKKVALASALALEAPLLLLDEPTQGLDGPSAARALREVRRHLERGGGAIIASHSGDFLFCSTDRLLALEAGTVLQYGSWPKLLLGGHESCLLPGGQLVAAGLSFGARPPTESLNSIADAADWMADRVAGMLSGCTGPGSGPGSEAAGWRSERS